MSKHYLFLSVFVVAAFCTPLSAQDEIMIGDELGPEHMIIDQWFIDPENHQPFRDNHYFYSTYQDGGFNYHRGEMRSDLWDTLGTGINAFARIMGAENLKFLAYAGTYADVNAYATWKSDRIQKRATAGINSYDQYELPAPWDDVSFKYSSNPGPNEWLIAKGNAVKDSTGDPIDTLFARYWIANLQENGFIIGDPNTQSTDYDDNWCVVPDYYMFNTHGWITDRYYIWFLVRMADDNAADDAPILAFHVNYLDSNAVWSDTIRYNPGDPEEGDTLSVDGWHWVQFEPEWPFNYSWQHFRFALQWLGSPGAGEVKIARIAYQSDRNYQLYGGDNETIPSPANQYCLYFGLAFYAHRVAFSQAGALGNLSGWLNGEPWFYAYKTHCDAVEYLKGEAFLNSSDFSAQYPGYSSDGYSTYLDATDVPSLYIDLFPINYIDTSGGWWHWEESINGDDGPINGLSIQDAWDNYTNDLEDAAEAAGGLPIHAGIQSSCELGDWDSVNTCCKLTKFAEPTPRMIKCQGFLAMTFAAKGFFYSYYGPKYSREGRPIIDTCFYSYPPFDHARFQYMNGARVSGLLAFCPDIADTSDTTIANGVELRSAVSLGGNETGWLWKSPKWYAAKEFNDYVRDVESFYLECFYDQSVCASEVNPVGRITIDSTYNAISGTDDPDSTYIQVGLLSGPPIFLIYAESQTFMLVNRRCAEAETRIVRFHISYTYANYLHSVREIASGEVLASGYGNSLSVVDTLEPGVGRLYSTSTNLQVSNDVEADTAWAGLAIVNGSINVLQGVTLEIKPGTVVFFEGNSEVTINGNILAKGKTDSLIIFTKLNSASSGLVQLNGSDVDTLQHCKFSHLNKGLKVSKNPGKDVYIDHCEFAYNVEEGIYATGGHITIKNSNIHDNGSDGAYLYNGLATIDTTTFHRNEKNGLYLYSEDASSEITNCEFTVNGDGGATSVDGNVRFYNCSPKMSKSTVSLGVKYGIYGANGAYPIMWNPSTAANTIEDNADHETYWDYSYPSLSYGHNNFDTEDDTIIYIDYSSLSSFDAKGNYWGGGPPDTATTLSFYCTNVSCAFLYGDWDLQEQTRVHGGEYAGEENLKDDPAGRIADNEEEAQDVFIRAVGLEEERPIDAMDAYRRIIREYGETAVAPIAVERLLWLTRSHYQDRERMDRLDNVGRYFEAIADTGHARGLVWKARRTSLWALAAQHRYDEAIRGFEAIIAHADNLADSIFAVIDVGTLHLEAREWAERDSSDQLDAIFGTISKLAPVDYPTHRKHTDELLAMLHRTGEFARRPLAPTEYFLDQNYPNPFNQVTRISYGLPEAATVKIRIYDVMGREMTTLINERQQAGYYTSIWDGKSQFGIQAASGMYFCRIEAGPFVKVKKMTLVK